MATSSVKPRIKLDKKEAKKGDIVEVKALDRPRLLQDVTATLGEHHVNIISSQNHAGGDRVAKMRFEFELGESSHLDTLLSRIRTIDSVYDAYRVVPGAGA